MPRFYRDNFAGTLVHTHGKIATPMDPVPLHLRSPKSVPEPEVFSHWPESGSRCWQDSKSGF